jgi:hypothetical protein
MAPHNDLDEYPELRRRGLIEKGCQVVTRIIRASGGEIPAERAAKFFDVRVPNGPIMQGTHLKQCFDQLGSAEIDV